MTSTSGSTRLGARLAAQLQRKHCFMVGRGTTAIRLALKVIERRLGRGEVIVPTMACPTVAQNVLYAGFTPVYVDVKRESCVMDVAAAARAITPRTRAILPVHLFGHACDMPGIMGLARERGLPVIEDACQSLGGTLAGKPLGGWGDYGVLSFGGTKIVSAGGGGALLCDDDAAAAEFADLLPSLPLRPPAALVGLLELSHRNATHAVIDVLRCDASLDLHSSFATLVPYYEPLYFWRFPEDGPLGASITQGLDGLKRTLDARLRVARAYEAGLRGVEGLEPVSGWAASGAVWRFSFLVSKPAKALAVTSALRKNGINASNHYWSTRNLLEGPGNPPATAYVCPRIVNLWVDDVATSTYIEKSLKVIEQAMNTEGNSP